MWICGWIWVGSELLIVLIVVVHFFSSKFSEVQSPKMRVKELCKVLLRHLLSLLLHLLIC